MPTTGATTGATSTGTTSGAATSGGATSGTVAGSTSSGTTGTMGTTGGSNSDACAVAGADVYISPSGSDGSGDGSASNPWASLGYADLHAPSGATIHAAPGSYAAAETTQSNRRFVSDTLWAAKVVATASGLAVWQCTGSDVDIDGFDVSGSADVGIYLAGDHDRAIHDYIHDLPATGCEPEPGGGVLIGEGTSADEAIGNEIFDVGDSSVSCPLWPGIDAAGSGSLIANNLVFLSSGFGLAAADTAASVTFVNNTVFANAGGGIEIVGLAEGGGSMRVVNNIVYRNGVGDGGLGGGGIVDPLHGGGADTFVDNLALFAGYSGDAGGDYSLALNSPALGNGTDAGAPPDDFLGAARPGVDGIDLGAYQSGSNAPSWPFCPTE